MEVIHLCPRFFPAISGGEFYMQRISEELQKSRKVNIALHCSNAIDFAGLRKQTPKSLPEATFQWHQLFTVYRHAVNSTDSGELITRYSQKYPNFLDQIKDIELVSFFKNGPSIPRFFSLVEESRFDIIHTTFLPYQTVVDGLICSKLHSVPSICTPFFHFANPRYSNINEIAILKYYSKIICCTAIEKTELCRRGVQSDRIEIIPMGVDVQKFDTARKEDFLDFYKIQHDRPIVLFCGYKNFEKGALTLLQAIPLVKNEIRDILFCFIGPSTKAFNYEVSKLKKEGFKTNILNINPSNLMGYFDKRKLGCFKACSVFVMPSRSDAYGISFLEAWAAGKPVIGANIGATPEIIREGFDGFLIEFDNPPKLAEKILFVLKNPELSMTLGKNGREKVQKNNNWMFIAQKLFRIYGGLVIEKSSKKS